MNNNINIQKYSFLFQNTHPPLILYSKNQKIEFNSEKKLNNQNCKLFKKLKNYKTLIKDFEIY
jgi:ethanolamine utilization protein EutP (predicted NTPase)